MKTKKFHSGGQSDKIQKYIFYIKQSEDMNHNIIDLSKDYSLKIWRPTIWELRPNGLFKREFLFWSIFHYLKLFSNSNYSIFIVYYGKEIVHYTVVLPKHYKFNFMAEDDLQIGPVWTHTEHRRKGIASFVIQKILEFYKKQDRRFWYVVREEHNVSRGFIEKASFTIYGKGIKKIRLGIEQTGSFIIKNQYL